MKIYILEVANYDMSDEGPNVYETVRAYTSRDKAEKEGKRICNLLRERAEHESDESEKAEVFAEIEQFKTYYGDYGRHSTYTIKVCDLLDD